MFSEKILKEKKIDFENSLANYNIFINPSTFFKSSRTQKNLIGVTVELKRMSRSGRIRDL